MPRPRRSRTRANKTRLFTADAEGEPVAVADSLTARAKWAQWMATADRTVARTVVGNTTVLTTFLGFDHGYDVTGPAVLWETVLITEKGTYPSTRYATRAAALYGHAQVLREVERLMKPKRPRKPRDDEGSSSGGRN